MNVFFRLTVRDEMLSKFKMSHNRFERKLTYESRDIVKEFEEIRRIRMTPTKEQSNDFDINESIEQGPDKIEHLSEQFSIESFIAVSEYEIIALKRKLHEKNIYMNKSITDMISKYTNFVEVELKSFLEL